MSNEIAAHIIASEEAPPQFVVDWIDGKRTAQTPAKPNYPRGMDIDFSQPHVKSCKVPLPYPAARCGFYSVTCNHCGCSVTVATAGRRDDPRSVTIPCEGDER